MIHDTVLNEIWFFTLANTSSFILILNFFYIFSELVAGWVGVVKTTYIQYIEYPRHAGCWCKACSARRRPVQRPARRYWRDTVVRTRGARGYSRYVSLLENDGPATYGTARPEPHGLNRTASLRAPRSTFPAAPNPQVQACRTYSSTVRTMILYMIRY